MWRVYNLVDRYQCFRGTCCLYLQERKEAAGSSETLVSICQTTGHHIPEDRSLKFILCKIWGFHGGDYDDYRLPEDDNHLKFILVDKEVWRRYRNKSLVSFFSRICKPQQCHIYPANSNVLLINLKSVYFKFSTKGQCTVPLNGHM
jgi:hypothetical protein